MPQRAAAARLPRAANPLDVGLWGYAFSRNAALARSEDEPGPSNGAPGLTLVGYLEHIRDAINDIFEYTQSGRDAFFADRMRQGATIRKARSDRPGRQASFMVASPADPRFRGSKLPSCARQSDPRLFWSEPRHRLGSGRAGIAEAAARDSRSTRARLTFRIAPQGHAFAAVGRDFVENARQ